MKKELLISLSVIGLMAGSNALAQTCTTPPSCETLGFNKTAADCEGKSSLKCPFDQSKLYCQDVDQMVNAAPGAIYYSDGTISDSVIPSKTPVGVVAYSDDSKGFVVTLEEAFKAWGEAGYDIVCLSNLNVDAARLDTQGKFNTQCLLSDTKPHPAAEYCNSFKAVSNGKGSSGWYLPAAGELYSMSFSYNAINLGLQKLSKTKISSGYYWSSSEYDDGYSAWFVRLFDGTIDVDYKYAAQRVRCVLAI